MQVSFDFTSRTVLNLIALLCILSLLLQVLTRNYITGTVYTYVYGHEH